jgi:hypothetical protein
MAGGSHPPGENPPVDNPPCYPSPSQSRLLRFGGFQRPEAGQAADGVWPRDNRGVKAGLALGSRSNG